MRKQYTIILFLIFFAAAKGIAQQNLISNGGFENSLNGWGFGNAKISSLIQNSGKASLALVAYVPGKWEGVDQKVKLPKNTKAIALSGFYKLEEVVQGKNDWNVAVIILEFTKVDQKIGESIVIVQEKGSTDWTAFEKIIAVPSDATGFRLMAALSEASGTFFVDDLNAKVTTLENVEKKTATNKQ